MDATMVALRVMQIENRLLEKHPKAAKDPVLASLIDALLQEIPEEAQAYAAASGNL